MVFFMFSRGETSSHLWTDFYKTFQPFFHIVVRKNEQQQQTKKLPRAAPDAKFKPNSNSR